MAKFEELFRMRADVEDADAIDTFLTERGVDFTVREDGPDTHIYGVLKGNSVTGLTNTVVANVEQMPYDEELGGVPTKITLTNGSTKIFVIKPDDYLTAYSESTKSGGIIHEIIKPSGVTQAQIGSEPITGFEDMEPYEYNTQLINGFIQFLLPYKLDAGAQEFLLSVMQEALDSCDEIREGSASVTDETYKTLLDKLNTKMGGNER